MCIKLILFVVGHRIIYRVYGVLESEKNFR